MKLLDLFCGAGGAAMGYDWAGFDEIVGVDNRPMPRYPFTFVQADALEYVRAHGREFDAIHASPPCQAYSIMRNLPWLRDKAYPRLITPTAEVLQEIGRPWVIENVMGAKLASGWLCGTMFGLPFFRHRFFWEGGWFWLQPTHASHLRVIHPGRQISGCANKIVYGESEDARGIESWCGRRGSHEGGHGLTIMPSMTGGLERWFRANGARRTGANVGHASGFEIAKRAMGCEWMRREELTQAVPPAYTEFIGRQLIQAIKNDTP